MPQPADQGVPTLELHDVSKAFGPVVALRSGNVVLHPGSIHALVGENGAGKSTLVKIIAGLYHRDSGTFELEGQPVAGRSVQVQQGKHRPVRLLSRISISVPGLTAGRASNPIASPNNM